MSNHNILDRDIMVDAASKLAIAARLINEAVAQTKQLFRHDHDLRDCLIDLVSLANAASQDVSSRIEDY